MIPRDSVPACALPGISDSVMICDYRKGEKLITNFPFKFLTLGSFGVLHITFSLADALQNRPKIWSPWRVSPTPTWSQF